MSIIGKHRKHAFVAKPAYGTLFREEWGILGAPCGRIHELVSHLAEGMDRVCNLVFLDADHAASGQEPEMMVLTDKIDFHRLDFKKFRNPYDLRILLNAADIGLINGNHFDASKQIVIIHEKKKDSLRRKLDRLTDVRMILLDEGQTDVFDFIKSHLNLSTVPIVSINDSEKICEMILQDWREAHQKINGLVLAGGRSQRMGMDKSLLMYHDTEQATYMADELSALIPDVYYSLSQREDKTFSGHYPVIEDAFKGLGPFGAILSALKYAPDDAWLVVACDQPLLNKSHLQRLIAARDPSKVATCFYNPETKFPEPLITIWEPKAYPRLLQFLAMGFACPRKVLINSDIRMLEVSDTDFMKNANTPEERQALLNYLVKE